MSATQKETKTRVQLDVSIYELERMNRIMELTGAGSRKELFNNAISFFEWAVSEIESGKDIASIDLDNQEITRLTMPAFQAVRNWRERKQSGDAEPVKVIK